MSTSSYSHHRQCNDSLNRSVRNSHARLERIISPLLLTYYSARLRSRDMRSATSRAALFPATCHAVDRRSAQKYSDIKAEAGKDMSIKFYIPPPLAAAVIQ